MHVKHCNQNSKKSCKNPGILQRLLIWKTWDDTLSLSIQNYARGCTKDFPLSSHQHCTHGTMRLTCSARPGLRGCIQLLAPSCQYVYQWRMKTTNRTRIVFCKDFFGSPPFSPHLVTLLISQAASDGTKGLEFAFFSSPAWPRGRGFILWRSKTALWHQYIRQCHMA